MKKATLSIAVLALLGHTSAVTLRKNYQLSADDFANAGEHPNGMKGGALAQNNSKQTNQEDKYKMNLDDELQSVEDDPFALSTKELSQVSAPAHNKFQKKAEFLKKYSQVQAKTSIPKTADDAVKAETTLEE